MPSESAPFEIPFLDLRLPYQELKAELDSAFERVMQSGRYILGEEVEAFEAEFAAYCGVRYCVSVANGLEALYLILKAYGIGKEDEVLVPSNTYIATWLAVSHAGGTPVPVEPARSTFNIDGDSLESCLTPRTRAIIAVHLYGQPAAMDGILRFAREHRLTVIEDASQAHGARFSGNRVGSLSDAAGLKLIRQRISEHLETRGVVTNDENLAQRIRILRNYGSPRKNVNTVRGYNSRLALQAAFLRVRLKHLDEWNMSTDVSPDISEELNTAEGCKLPIVPHWAQPVWHQFVIRHETDCEITCSNAALRSIHSSTSHLSEAYSDHAFASGGLKRTEELAGTILSLPMNPHLQPEHVQNVSRAILELGG